MSRSREESFCPLDSKTWGAGQVSVLGSSPAPGAYCLLWMCVREPCTETSAFTLQWTEKRVSVLEDGMGLGRWAGGAGTRSEDPRGSLRAACTASGVPGCPAYLPGMDSLPGHGAPWLCPSEESGLGQCPVLSELPLSAVWGGEPRAGAGRVAGPPWVQGTRGLFPAGGRRQAPGHFLPAARWPAGGSERGGRLDNCDLLSADECGKELFKQPFPCIWFFQR